WCRSPRSCRSAKSPASASATRWPASIAMVSSACRYGTSRPAKPVGRLSPAWHFDRMTEEDLSLAAEFAPARHEDWLKLVATALKGAPFEKLVAKTYDDLRIQPLYAGARDAKPVAARSPGAAWQVMQRVDHPDPAAANAEALHDLENGATGLQLVFSGAPGAHGYGLDASAATLTRVLDAVVLDAGIAIELELSPQAKDAAGVIADLVKSRGVASAAADIRFGFDPLGAMAAAGTSALAWSDLAPRFAGLVGDLSAQGLKGPFAAADARVVHAAGGSEAQELGYALGVALAYLRAIETGGTPLDQARRKIF